MRTLILIISALAVSACTSIPEQIQGEFEDVSPARVDSGITGTEVRWGGVILGTRVESDTTCFEVLSRRLDKYLRPKVEDQTAGRYIACKAGFHDPEVFSKGREITVTGQIRGIETRPVESFDYRYPVLDVDQLVLWQKRRNVVVYRGFYDPWYGPHWGPYWGPYWGGYWGYRGWGYGPHPYYWGPGPGYVEVRQLLPDASEFEPKR
jgi:outer membrane lipoprotein